MLFQAGTPCSHSQWTAQTPCTPQLQPITARRTHHRSRTCTLHSLHGAHNQAQGPSVQVSSLPTADRAAAPAGDVAAMVAAAVVPPVPTACVPEDLQLPPGQLSTIDRVGKGLDADTFRCFGCVREECKVGEGLAGGRAD